MDRRREVAIAAMACLNLLKGYGHGMTVRDNESLKRATDALIMLVEDMENNGRDACDRCDGASHGSEGRDACMYAEGDE